MSAVLDVSVAPAQLATVRLEAIPAKIRAEIIERVKVGVPAGTAAVSCGVNRRTFQRWLERGRREDGRDPYRRFARQIDEAFAAWQFSKVKEIDIHSAKDWRAGAWMLERLNPTDFADPNRAGGTQVNVSVTLELERKQAADDLLAAATRAFADDPVALERLLAELAVGQPAVVDGEAVELVELAP